MQIKEVPIEAFQSEPKQLRIAVYRFAMWHWNKTSNDVAVDAPVAVEYRDLILQPGTDPNGAPCYRSYDHEADTLYVCYDR